MDVNKNDPIEDDRLEFLPRLSISIDKNQVHLIFEYLWFGFKIKL
jgi:hypothetical protein